MEIKELKIIYIIYKKYLHIKNQIQIFKNNPERGNK